MASTVFRWLCQIIYDVDGDLDEYRRQQVDHLGNQVAVFLLTTFLALDLIVSVLSRWVAASTSLTILLLANLLLLVIADRWVKRVVRRRGRNRRDIPASELPQQLRRARRQGFWYGVCMGLLLIAIGWPVAEPFWGVLGGIVGIDRYQTLKQRLHVMS